VGRRVRARGCRQAASIFHSVIPYLTSTPPTTFIPLLSYICCTKFSRIFCCFEIHENCLNYNCSAFGIISDLSRAKRGHMRAEVIMNIDCIACRQKWRPAHHNWFNIELCYIKRLFRKLPNVGASLKVRFIHNREDPKMDETSWLSGKVGRAACSSR